MMLGHGIDIIELSRVRRHIEVPGGEWILATFTANERATADSPPNDVRYFAGRFAAKEAIAKALGTGICGDMAWSDIEILREPSGAPSVSLFAATSLVAQQLGVSRWLLSISHSEHFVVASAIALAE